jgi:hypothetical protein
LKGLVGLIVSFQYALGGYVLTGIGFFLQVTEMKPARKRSEKQIVWSKELGANSQIFKKAKREK